MNRRCFDAAADVLNILSDLGVAVKVGRGADGERVLMVRDKQGLMSDLLRLRLMDVQGEVIALLSRYDRYFAGFAGAAVDTKQPRRLPQDVYARLLEAYQPGGNGTLPRDEFWAEGRWMAAVWEAKALAGRCLRVRATKPSGKDTEYGR